MDDTIVFLRGVFTKNQFSQNGYFKNGHKFESNALLTMWLCGWTHEMLPCIYNQKNILVILEQKSSVASKITHFTKILHNPSILISHSRLGFGFSLCFKLFLELHFPRLTILMVPCWCNVLKIIFTGVLRHLRAGIGGSKLIMNKNADYGNTCVDSYTFEPQKLLQPS